MTAQQKSLSVEDFKNKRCAFVYILKYEVFILWSSSFNFGNQNLRIAVIRHTGNDPACL